MARERKTSGWRDAADDPVPLELPPDRAFVLHLDTRARPPRHVVGRIEHVSSGRVAYVASLRGVVAFLTDVLGDQAPGNRDEMAPRGSRQERGER